MSSPATVLHQGWNLGEISDSPKRTPDHQAASHCQPPPLDTCSPGACKPGGPSQQSQPATQHSPQTTFLPCALASALSPQVPLPATPPQPPPLTWPPSLQRLPNSLETGSWRVHASNRCKISQQSLVRPARCQSKVGGSTAGVQGQSRTGLSELGLRIPIAAADAASCSLTHQTKTLGL